MLRHRKNRYNDVYVDDFNPRPREEGDLFDRQTDRRYKHISIHALVKRATWWWHYTTTINYNFNPRPREEGDLLYQVFLIIK